MPKATLDELRPSTARRVIDLVAQAGIDVADWANYDGVHPGKNPKYCYEWSFAAPKKVVVLNLWFDQMAVEDGHVVQNLSFRDIRSEKSNSPKAETWRRRRRNLERHVRMAFSEHLPVRIIVCDGNRRDADEPDPPSSKVRRRKLDDIAWAVTTADYSRGVYTITRGARPPAAQREDEAGWLAVEWANNYAKGYVDLIPASCVFGRDSGPHFHPFVSQSGKALDAKFELSRSERGIILDYSAYPDHRGNEGWEPYVLQVRLDEYGQVARVEHRTASVGSLFKEAGIRSHYWVDDLDTFINARSGGSDARRGTRPGQPGPAPSEWSSVTRRCDGPTSTYVFRFGNRNVWKVGISQNPKARCKALNYSVPHEVLHEKWELFRCREWPNGSTAYQMEQSLLKHLESVECERVLCAEEALLMAWDLYLQRGLQSSQK